MIELLAVVSMLAVGAVSFGGLVIYGTRQQLERRRQALLRWARERRGRFVDGDDAATGGGYRAVAHLDGVPVTVELAEEGVFVLRARARYLMGAGPRGVGEPPLLDSALLSNTVWGVPSTSPLSLRLLSRYSWSGEHQAMRLWAGEAAAKVADEHLRRPTIRSDGRVVEVTHPFLREQLELLSSLADPLAALTGELARWGEEKAAAVAREVGGTVVLRAHEDGQAEPEIQMGRVRLSVRFVEEPMPHRLLLRASLKCEPRVPYEGQVLVGGLAPPLPAELATPRVVEALRGIGRCRLRTRSGEASLSWVGDQDAETLQSGAALLEAIASLREPHGAFR